MKLPVPMILASLSPRRRSLLEEAGVEFTVLGADEVVERHDPALPPESLTIENARAKARAVAVRRPEALVLGADTLVYLDGAPLGKPGSLDEAAGMLRRLSGRAHQVCTGVCLCWDAGGGVDEFHELTTVHFRPLSDAMIAEYLARVPVLDKAGAYAMQDHGALVVASIDGSWSNVVGLPMEKTLAALARWRRAPAPPPAGPPAG
jgi:septum formation protein